MTLVILGIIDKLLDLSIEIVKGMPDAAKQAFWERHDARMQWWQDKLTTWGDKADEKPAA